MAIDKASLLSRIAPRAKDDPELFAVLRQLILEAEDIQQQVSVFQTSIIQRETTRLLPAILDPSVVFGFIFGPQSVLLFWSIETTYYYEIRKGDTWDEAARIAVTPANSLTIQPLAEGTHRFLLRAIDTEGQISSEIQILDIEVPSIPSFTVNARTLDNYVLLSWTAPNHVFDIHRYIVRRGGEEIGTSESLFHTIFELAAGEYSYSIQPVSVSGSLGPEISIDVELRAPKDYQYDKDERDILDVPNAKRTLTQGLVKDDRVLTPVNVEETWAEHFINNGKTTIQDFIDQGFNYWFQPTPANSVYSYVFDFLAIHENRFMRFAYNIFKAVDDAGLAVTHRHRWSDDNAAWSEWSNLNNNFIPRFRYVEVQVRVANPNLKAMIEIWNLTITLEVLFGSDQGIANVLASDTVLPVGAGDGTLVEMNQDFKSIDSVVATPREVAGLVHVIVREITIPNSFRLIAYDDNGNLTDASVSWIVRGKV